MARSCDPRQIQDQDHFYVSRHFPHSAHVSSALHYLFMLRKVKKKIIIFFYTFVFRSVVFVCRDVVCLFRWLNRHLAQHTANHKKNFRVSWSFRWFPSFRKSGTVKFPKKATNFLQSVSQCQVSGNWKTSENFKKPGNSFVICWCHAEAFSASSELRMHPKILRCLISVMHTIAWNGMK